MEVCQDCGRPQRPGTVFCTGCGQRFPATAESPAGHTRPGPQLPIALIAAAGAVVIVAIGAGLFFSLRPGHQHIRATAQSALSSHVPSAPQTAQDSASPPPSISSAPPTLASAPPATPSAAATPIPTSGPSTIGSVTVSADAARNPDATAIATFINQYYSTINSHNFQAYYSLLTPQLQQGETAEKFSKGYWSTTDIGETLVLITPAANGDTAATLTFTSHQNAAQAGGGAGTCADWNITLFPEPNGTGYLDGESPPPITRNINLASSA